MPKKAKELSATEVKRLTFSVSKDGKPYNTLHAVGGVSGLLLQVTPTGAKSWIYRTVVGTKRKNIGLGGYPDVSLSEARSKAKALRDDIIAGIDPVEQRKANRRALIAAQLSSITFDKAAAEFIKMKEKEFRNPRQSAQWTASLESYAMPHIGKVPVREISLPHIKAVLDPIWQEKTETAKRVQGRIENILGWCAIHGYRSEENPARWRGYLDKVYPAPNKTRKRAHHAALRPEALPAFMQSLQKRTGTAARALEFVILTASRTSEVIGDRRINKAGITWGEIDFSKKVWTVPADRMKSGKEHRVPLTDAAIKVLDGMERGAPDALIFTSPKGGIPSDNFMTALIKRMGVDTTVHGFRSTFKDWAREYTAYADEVSELALAHVNDDKTRAAYARSQLIDKRRLLMNDWENFCYHGKQEKTDKVVNIGGGR